MGLIELSAVLKEIDRPPVGGRVNAFNISFIKADLIKKTGGELCSLKGAELAKYSSPKSVGRKFKGVSKRDWKNAIRTLYIPHKREFVSVHIYLITEFNGMEVIW